MAVKGFQRFAKRRGTGRGGTIKGKGERLFDGKREIISRDGVVWNVTEIYLDGVALIERKTRYISQEMPGNRAVDFDNASANRLNGYIA